MHNKPLFSSRSRNGFTLTEVAIVLGILGLILGGIWAAASTVYTSWRVTHTVNVALSLVNTLQTSARGNLTLGIQANTNLYSFINSLNLLPMGSFTENERLNPLEAKLVALADATESAGGIMSSLLLPHEAQAQTSSGAGISATDVTQGYTTAWGTSRVYIYTTNVNVAASDSDAFDLIFDNIPNVACKRLMRQLTNMGKPYMVTGQAGSTSGSDVANYSSYTQPITDTEIAGYCAGTRASSLGFRFLVSPGAAPAVHRNSLVTM